jgi:outer membrane protein assembly factor BamB
MPSFLFACIATVLLASSTLAQDANWPEFRGPGGAGHAVAEGYPTTWGDNQNVKWKLPLPGRAWSSPVIWGQQLWLTNATEDGKKLWALCIDKDSGKVIRELPMFEVAVPLFCHKFNSYASPTPVIEEGRVYLSWGSAGIACVDTNNFNVLWVRRDLECDHFRGAGASPILFENLLIEHYDGHDYQYVVALDKSTGQTVWKTNRPTDFRTTDGDVKKAYATPIVVDVNGRPVLISPSSKGAFAYDARTGEEIWRIVYDSFSTASRPVYGHGLVYLSTGFGKADLIAVKPDGQGDVTSSHIAWLEKKQMPSKPSPLLVDDLIYTIGDQGVATCLDAKTGQQVWLQRIGGNYSAAPIYAAGHIYLFSEEGKTTVFKAGRDYEKVAENQFTVPEGAQPDGFMATPAASGKALYLRTRGHLYRVEN